MIFDACFVMVGNGGKFLGQIEGFFCGESGQADREEIAFSSRLRNGPAGWGEWGGLVFHLGCSQPIGKLTFKSLQFRGAGHQVPHLIVGRVHDKACLAKAIGEKGSDLGVVFDDEGAHVGVGNSGVPED